VVVPLLGLDSSMIPFITLRETLFLIIPDVYEASVGFWNRGKQWNPFDTRGTD